MIRLLTLVALLSLLVAVPNFAHAQIGRKSPHETISRLIDGHRITIVYGRPYTRDPLTGERRAIWGKLVPHDKIWRFGADEATLFITQVPLRMGELSIPAGAYTLFMVVRPDGSAKLLVNREIGQFGVDPYRVDLELGRVDLQREPLNEPVDQFTIEILNGETGGGVLDIAWDRTKYTVRFEVKG